jgi:hypothetical protein
MLNNVCGATSAPSGVERKSIPLGTAVGATAPVLIEDQERTVLLDLGGRVRHDGFRFRLGLGIGGHALLTADEQEGDGKGIWRGSRSIF